MGRYTPTRREILINSSPYEKRVAILENNHLAEIFYSYPESDVFVGNIYKGVVNAVLPGLQAAFVDLGLEKAGFLHVEDVLDRTKRLRREFDDDDDSKSASTKPETIDNLLKIGQEILVQITKAPISTKGPRITTHLTLAGRFLVCMPTTDFVGVSKKSRDHNHRRNLRKMVQKLKGKGIGYIVRTLGLNESEEEFIKQMEILESKWEICRKKAEVTEAPGLVLEESSTIETSLRDYFSENVEAVLIDNKEEFESVKNYVKVLSPDKVDKVHYFKKDISIFDYYGLEEELEKTFESKVHLRRGGYLVIEQTEALVSIDVNTGGKVRGSDQSKNIIETNIDAAWEIAKQIRLRDLGGLIIIDFIDMEKEEDVLSVENEFKKAIRQDKSPIHFALISQFGLMELTRKRTRPNTVKHQSKICPTCQGNRYIPKNGIVMASIDRWLRRFKADSKVNKINIILHPNLIAAVTAARGYIVKYWEMKHKLAISLFEDEQQSVVDFRIFETESGNEITHQYLTSYNEEPPANLDEE